MEEKDLWNNTNNLYMKKEDHEMKEVMRRSLITHEDEKMKREFEMKNEKLMIEEVNYEMEEAMKRSLITHEDEEIRRRNIEMDYDVNNSYEQESYIIKEYNKNKIVMKKITTDLVKLSSNSNILEVMFELVNEQAKLLIQLNKIRNKYQKKY